MQIALHNIQSIEHAVLDFPETGIVSFTGDNSNGKSIIEKALTGLVCMEIMDREVRESLIRDGENDAYFVIIIGNKSLSCKLHSERDQTVVQYIPNLQDNTTAITRSLREGGIEELIYEFGFRVYGNNQLCLQIYPTYGLMPFINTSPALNGEIVDDVTHDKMADAFIENYKEITYPTARRTITEYKQREVTLSSTLNAMTMYDWRSYEKLLSRISACKDFFEHYVTIDFRELRIPPNVRVIDLPKFTLREIKVTRLAPTYSGFREITSSIKNYVEVLNGKCPTCGKPLNEEGCI